MIQMHTAMALQRHRVWLVFTVFVSLLITSSTRAQLCEGTLYNNLIPGDTATIITEENLNLRDQPTTSGSKLGKLAPETVVKIISGPVCADGYSWYEIELEDGTTGWVAEADYEDVWVAPDFPREKSTYERPADPNGTNPRVTFEYPVSNVKRISEDVAVAHGRSWDGSSILITTFDDRVIFITVIDVESMRDSPDHAAALEILQTGLAANSDDILINPPHFTDNQGQAAIVASRPQFGPDFINGEGIHTFVFYGDAESFDPVVREGFDYVYYGLTNDGKFYVTLSTQVMSPALPESPPHTSDDMTPYFEGYAAWIEEIEAFLLTTNPASFSSTVIIMNTIIRTLEIATP